MLDAFYRVGLDSGFLVAAKIDVGEDQQGLRTIGDVKSTVEAHGLDAAFLAASLVEGVGEGYGLVVDLIGKMRWQQSNRQRDGRFDLQAEFLSVVVWSHETVDLGHRRDLVFFVEDAAPVELRLKAMVVLDVEIVWRNELSHSRSEDGTNGGEDGLLGPALIAEGDDHPPFGGKMTLVNRAGDMLLHAEETEIRRGSGVPYGGVPFVGPSHGHGDRVSGVDLHMHVAAPDSGIVDVAGVQAGGLQRDRLAVGSNPDRKFDLAHASSRPRRRTAAGEDRGENRKVPHIRSIGWVHCAHPNEFAAGGLRRYQVPVEGEDGARKKSAPSVWERRSLPGGPPSLFVFATRIAYVFVVPALRKKRREVGHPSKFLFTLPSTPAWRSVLGIWELG